MPQRLIPALALSAAAALFASNAAASSGDAWEAFRTEVSKKCLSAATSLEKASAVVDPFGSKSFGLALVIGTPKGSKTAVTQICVYDKHKKTVELGGELTPETVTIKAPAKAR
ncbi:hypothetical protein LAC81_03430 [Ensifer adhaerens]|uniref:hypothetical protein n=1 Tax=Ensifer adhaerens TaxID=106592 RepID=UPI001CC1000C|nr:hypothetical protein [Ensifer adhaerens]MBZ7920840.1 hypothetical protein [Ensifer adhaerens]UAX93293.1 hypothetical protein LAC78_03425 [Ensifer adhaerens]UAY00930.1 hypothetical protein LAC80_03430 [Ensifer adhaerens]UAY08311.1 hypothetical protein LAC81_03430 [Ensifer adhaerens]